MRTTAKVVMAWAACLAASASAGAHDGHGYLAGEPGSAKRATKVVEIAMTDADGAMSFEPNHLVFKHGESVKFVIHNQGKLSHEFVLGAKSENSAHAAMMAEMPDMKHNDPNAATVGPGQTTTLVWRFTRTGEFEFACLIPGHYQSGMHGVVVVR